jgi:branched-chain amino acid transport system ATP-binding protein
MLEISGLQVSYGRVDAVRDFHAEVEPGAITIVLGANGAGKTSSLRAIAGLVRSGGGTVAVDGVDVTGRPAHRVVEAGISLVPEGRKIFAPLTVEENLRLGGYRAKRVVAAATMAHVYETFPILRERRSGAAGLLSGGEQQMLAFGRALMSQPKYILMDEPSMGLAPVIVDRVLATARDIADTGIGVLMVEQNADAGLRVADRVVVMDRGEVVFSGSARGAETDKEVLRAYLGESALVSGGEQG